MTLRHRVARLEQGNPVAFTLTEAIDRPPAETREQWIARQAGHPVPGLVNSLGETREQWVARRTNELATSLGGPDQ